MLMHEKAAIMPDVLRCHLRENTQLLQQLITKLQQFQPKYRIGMI